MIRLGVSACLLGQNVRYDRGHQLDRYLRDELGKFVEWVPVCPEVECGLPIPREAMRLVNVEGQIRILTRQTGIDHTDRMIHWAKSKMDAMNQLDLCGFIFKSKSPSSGMASVKVYEATGNVPKKNGIGLFANQLMQHFPLLPVEDEGRLNDPDLRENFIERIFVYSRWKEWNRINPTLSGLIAFHTDHKLLVMAHSHKLLGELGKMTEGRPPKSLEKLLQEYLTVLMTALRLPATIKKNVNVLQHIMGYFKNQLSPDEKQEILEIIEAYHKGFTPLIVPITVLGHYVRKFDQTYLKNQVYLHPHPVELMLRNHV